MFLHFSALELPSFLGRSVISREFKRLICNFRCCTSLWNGGKQFAVNTCRTTTDEERDELVEKLAVAKAARKKKGVLEDIMEKLVAEGEERGIAKGEAKSLSRLLERSLVLCPLPSRGGSVGPTSVNLMRGSTGCWMQRAWVRCSGWRNKATLWRRRVSSAVAGPPRTRQYGRWAGRAKQTPICDKSLGEQPALDEPMALDSFRGK